jgi:hypothetical protein
MRNLTDASFRDGGTPNNDKLYSTARVDISKELVILSHPEMGDRYFTFQLACMDDDNFAFVGKRTTGSKGGNFAIASYVGDRMRALMKEHDFRVIVLECSAIPDIEYTALVMLTEGRENLEKRGVELWLSTLNPDLFRMIERSPLGEKLGHDRMFFNLQIALEAYLAKGIAKA